MEQDVHKIAALRGRPTDGNTEELLDLVRNQEKEVNPVIMFENIVLKKACLRPLQDATLPSINPDETLLSRHKLKSFPGHWLSSDFVITWTNTNLVDRPFERTKPSEPWFYKKTLLLDSKKDCMKSHSNRRLRTRSLLPLGFTDGEEFQRPECPTPSHGCGCKGNRWKEECEWKQ